MDTDPLPASPASLLILLSQSAPAISFTAPPDWFSWTILIILAFCCLMISAFVSGSEIAYFGLTPQELNELEESEEPRDKKPFFLIEHSERLLATILIANNLVNITMVVLLTFAISQTVIFNSSVVNFLLQTVFLTFLLLLFGEIFPKLVARTRTMWWVRFAAPGVKFLYDVLGPLSRIMVKSTTIVNKVITKKQENISTDELEKALEISDVADGKEKEMLEGILTFGEIEAHEIMISRVDMTSIEYHDTWRQAMKVILDSGFSRIPVYDTTLDSIRGILYSKDLLPHIDNKDEDFRWQNLLREAYFVPESRMIDDLLEDFRKKKIHIAIVVDEYGGTQGIVTLEDIIEQIVGEIDDEYDEVSLMYKKVSDNAYIFDAKIPLTDFYHILDMEDSEIAEEGDSETLAGLILEIKGDFPVPKEVIEKDNLRFTIIKMEKHRIVRVKVEVLTPRSGDEADSKDKNKDQ